MNWGSGYVTARRGLCEGLSLDEGVTASDGRWCCTWVIVFRRGPSIEGGVVVSGNWFWARRDVNRLIRSDCTAADIESPLPSASEKTIAKNSGEIGQEKKLTWVASLANFTPSPVQIVTFLADPIAGLMFNRSAVSCIQDGGLLRCKSADDQS